MQSSFEHLILFTDAIYWVSLDSVLEFDTEMKWKKLQKLSCRIDRRDTMSFTCLVWCAFAFRLHFRTSSTTNNFDNLHGQAGTWNVHDSYHHPTNYCCTNTPWSLPSICYDPLHHPALIPGLACHISTTSFQVFLGLPLCLAPTSKVVHFSPSLYRPSVQRVHVILICFAAPQ